MEKLTICEKEQPGIEAERLAGVLGAIDQVVDDAALRGEKRK